MAPNELVSTITPGFAWINSLLILSKAGKIKTRFYSLDSDEDRDMVFSAENLDSVVEHRKDGISDYGYF